MKTHIAVNSRTGRRAPRFKIRYVPDFKVWLVMDFHSGKSYTSLSWRGALNTVYGDFSLAGQVT